MKRVVKHTILFSIFGGVYVAIEFVYRGYSHWTMFLLGGLCGVVIGLINELLPWNIPIWIQGCIGSMIITTLEFVCGIVVNVWLKMRIWDYSHLPCNILGQVCLPFSIIWFVIAHIAIILDDYLRYWMFEEEKPHYTLWF